jgi:hypothetical protein
MNNIKILRPLEFRGSFDADENVSRECIYEKVIPQIKKERHAEEVAELMFHILNAPEEILSEVELDIANEFRAAGHYSLSTGDIVEVDGSAFLCESFGWKEVTLTYGSTRDIYNYH